MASERYQLMLTLCLTSKIEHTLDALGATGTSLSDKVKSFDEYDDHESDELDNGYAYRQYKRALLYGHYNDLRHIAHERNQMMHREGYHLPLFIVFEKKCRSIIKDLSGDTSGVCASPKYVTSLLQRVFYFFYSLFYITHIVDYAKGVFSLLLVWYFINLIFKLDMLHLTGAIAGLFVIPVLFTAIIYLYKGLDLLLRLSIPVLSLLMSYIIWRLWSTEPVDMIFKTEVLHYLAASLGVFYLLVTILFLTKKVWRMMIRRWKSSSRRRDQERAAKVQNAAEDIRAYPNG